MGPHALSLALSGLRTVRMTNQRPLFDPGVALGNMKPAETLILKHVEQSEGGLTAQQADRLVHADSGAHAEDVSCAYCTSTGRRVLDQLKARQLVKQRRSGIYQAVRRRDNGSIPF